MEVWLIVIWRLASLTTITKSKFEQAEHCLECNSNRARFDGCRSFLNNAFCPNFSIHASTSFRPRIDVDCVFVLVFKIFRNITVWTNTKMQEASAAFKMYWIASGKLHRFHIETCGKSTIDWLSTGSRRIDVESTSIRWPVSHWACDISGK